MAKTMRAHPAGQLQPATAGGCPTCGAPVAMTPLLVEAVCPDCGALSLVRFACESGHASCDRCRIAGYVAYLRQSLGRVTSDDPVEVFLTLRRGYPAPVHGPEHHGLVAAALLFAYHHTHGNPKPDVLMSAVNQAALLPPGTCGLWGACSAALAVGIAVATLIDSTPKRGRQRAAAQSIVAHLLGRLGEQQGARCCRRESLIVLQETCVLSAELLPGPLVSSMDAVCDQYDENVDCQGAACPFYPALPRPAPPR
jgi:7,8-dihydro-6-hydroxymethylpterin dimethyltransferase